MATKTRKSTVADDYLALIKRFPLAPIRNDRRLKEAHRMIDALSILGEENLTPGQLDYLLVLGDLTTAHESEAFESMTRKVSGLDLLKHLAEENNLSGSDIGRILGQRELGAKVLGGIRKISREHARALGEHFGLPGEIFLR